MKRQAAYDQKSCYQKDIHHDPCTGTDRVKESGNFVSGAAGDEKQNGRLAKQEAAVKVPER
ncbi:MAG TPA: hypothetical protein PLX08_14175 [Bacteroidales bacterium]|nr:hypothetical protein [Bacteroidales bacterium]